MHIEKKTLKYIFFVVAASIFLYWILHETDRVLKVYSVVSGMLSPFITGACIAFILNVPMRGFERVFAKIKNDRFRRITAITATMVCVLVVLSGVVMLLIPQLIEAIEKLGPSLYRFFLDLETNVKTLIRENSGLIDWFRHNANLEELNWAGYVEQIMGVVGDGLTRLLSSVFVLIGGVFGALFNTIIALVFALYCLFQKETLARQGRKLLYAFLPERGADWLVHVLRLTNSTFSNFLSGQCIEVCILGCLFAVTMAIFKMPYIPLISVLIAITAFIPVVGAWIGCVFGAFFIFVNNPTSLQALWFIIMFIVLQQIENNMIYPRVVGTSIGLSGMWVLLAVAVGGELFGVAGMFLMIPLASVIYTIIREITNKRITQVNVPEEKLRPQPPEIQSKFKTNRQNKKTSSSKKQTAQNTSEKETEN